MCRESSTDSIVDPSCVNVGNRDRGAARLAGHGSSQQANGTGSNYQSSGARLRFGTVDRMNSNGQGFKKRSGLIRDIVGKPAEYGC